MQHATSHDSCSPTCHWRVSDTRQTRTILLRPNDVVRLSLTRRCNERCTFCHNEGNSALRDLPAPDVLIPSLVRLRQALGTSRVHLTGGEPTLYPAIHELVPALHHAGFQVAMTTSGSFDLDAISSILSAFHHVNFSIHALPATHHAATTRRSCARSRHALSKSDILLETSRHVPVAINTVVYSLTQDLAALYSFAKTHSIPLRLLPAWQHAAPGTAQIRSLLARHRCRYSHSLRIWPGSNIRDFWVDSDGYTVEHKVLTRYCLPELSDRCDRARACLEGFAFVRLEGTPITVRTCVHQNGSPFVQPLDSFVHSPLATQLSQMIACSSRCTES